MQVMKKLVGRLIGSRDEGTVTYSRFGLAGDETGEGRAPTHIVVGAFDRQLPRYRLGSLCHSQKAALLSAGVGLSFVLLIFISSFFKFDWYNKQRGVDLLAIAALLLFLVVGVVIHYAVIKGIEKERAHLLVPFLICYMVLMTIEVIVSVSALVDLIADHSSRFETHHKTAVEILLLAVPSLAVQALMLVSVHKCKLYITDKTLHQLTMKVAEKSVSENRCMGIVLSTEQNVPCVNGTSAVPVDSQCTVE